MSSLIRWLPIVFLLGVLLLAGAGLIWYLAFGIAGTPPDRLSLTVISAPVQIDWGTQGDVTIGATNEQDAAAALGFVHGWQRSWSIALWRQAALGRLGEWFGEPALEIDRLTRRLGLASLAEASYAAMEQADQAYIRAYTDGLNEALETSTGSLRQEFVLLDVAPEPWEPWHTLALERLFAWLASPPPPPDHPALSRPDVAAFYAADRALRQWLQLYGFENSVAWAMRDSLGTLFFQRHVYGATALPFLQETTVQGANATTVSGATLPGTPFFPAGQTTDHAWSLFFSGTTRLVRTPWDASALSATHQRLQFNDGAEHLLSFYRMGEYLPLETPSPGADLDSVWAIAWAGFSPTSDLAAWQAVRAGRAVTFSLLQGHGLRVDRTGTWQVLGTPLVDVQLPTGVFIGNTHWSSYAATLLHTQEPGPVPVRTWIDDAYSIWAAQHAPSLIEAVRPGPAPALDLRDAYTYLRNWDFAYDRTSIAASIFDTWISFYQDTAGPLPSLDAPPDSVLAADPRLHQTLQRAIDYLSDTFGPDQSQWRWERIHPDRRLFPIWSAPDLEASSARLRARSRYAPLVFPGHGHPSSLAWNPSPIQHSLPASANWEAWIRTDDWDGLTVRRRGVAPYAPLGRYLTSDRPPNPFPLKSPDSPKHTTTLIPLTPPS